MVESAAGVEDFWEKMLKRFVCCFLCGSYESYVCMLRGFGISREMHGLRDE